MERNRIVEIIKEVGNDISTNSPEKESVSVTDFLKHIGNYNIGTLMSDPAMSNVLDYIRENDQDVLTNYLHTINGKLVLEYGYPELLKFYMDQKELYIDSTVAYGETDKTYYAMVKFAEDKPLPITGVVYLIALLLK